VGIPFTIFGVNMPNRDANQVGFGLWTSLGWLGGDKCYITVFFYPVEKGFRQGTMHTSGQAREHRSTSTVATAATGVAAEPHNVDLGVIGIII
jgi:hypothetical protein